MLPLRSTGVTLKNEKKINEIKRAVFDKCEYLTAWCLEYMHVAGRRVALPPQIK